MKSPKTLQDAILYFAEFENCRQFMLDLRWPEGKVTCPTCGSERVTYLATQRRWKCYAKHPKPQFSLKTGTIFEDSPLGLDKWLVALWLLVNCKNGISSMEIARDLGITQKSAWFMAHRLRFALHHGSFDKLSGEVEVDETFIGGKARNMHKAERARKIPGRGPEGKAIVSAVLERKGRVRATVTATRKKKDLHALIRDNVEVGSELFSDALKSYDGLSDEFIHQVIDHAKSYVEGSVHTNGCENFWALLKRGLNGTYISVEPFHLFRYVDEQAFRYNNRNEMTDADRFSLVCSQITGRRLTWKALTAQES